MKRGHITKAERLEISLLRKKGYSIRDIAGALGRSHSSISREISRNSVEGIYDSEKAHHKAYVKRKYSKFEGMKIRNNGAVEQYVKDHLVEGWTPEQIAGRLKEIDTHLPYVIYLGIYKWLYSSYGQAFCRYLPSERYRRKKRRKKKTKRMLIPNRIGIEKRPEEANNRTCFGHFEGDTIVSGKQYSSTSLAVMLERKARYVKLRKIKNLKPINNNSAAKRAMKNFACIKTLTLDNGIENTQHEKLSKQLRIAIYFCDPYSSWQKGSVENINGFIRRFIPKGSNIAAFSHQFIAAVEHKLNHTPRKCLNFKTPSEVMSENNLFINKISHPCGAFGG
jgi:IS30 family transposase